MLQSRAIECFTGGWQLLNATLTNTTTGQLAPDWHGVYPDGLTTYAPNGYYNFILTANDTTEPEKRPRELTLPAQPTDSDARWALVGKYSLAAGGNPTYSDVCGRCNFDGVSKGATGNQTTVFSIATLPSWEGLKIVNEFEFFEGGNLHVLRAYFNGLVQTVWFRRLGEGGRPGEGEGNGKGKGKYDHAAREADEED